jgi:hypothetical protein
MVVNIDLSNFFGSVGFDDLMHIYQTRFNYDWEAAETLARLTTYDDCLPQGAPTSPALANIAALDLDSSIIKLCSEQIGAAFNYTRYIDDITISGDQKIAALIPEFYTIIEQNGFEANRSKTKILRQGTQQKVTGVVVNAKLSPPRKLVRKLRQQVYYCEKFGVREHCNKLNAEPDKFIRKLRGQIAYIRMTRPELADKLTCIIGSGLPLRSLSSEDERKLLLLSTMIEGERIAIFKYENVECKAAPSSITVDDLTGKIVLLAFQLDPEQGWKRYLVSEMSELLIHGIARD